MRDAPLAGVTVLVTRAREQSAALAGPLEDLGALVLATPAIRFEDPEDWAPADRALRDAGGYAWAIFTSANGVEAVERRLRILGLGWEALAGPRLAAIGPGTAAALKRRGLDVALVPEVYQAEGILEALGPEPLEGRRILLARAAVARDVLPEELRRRGALVDVVAVYRTLPAPPAPAALSALQQAARSPVVVTFTSASTVTHFLDGLPEAARAALRSARIAAIGPVTADELRRRGVEPAILPVESTIPALVEAIRAAFAR